MTKRKPTGPTGYSQDRWKCAATGCPLGGTMSTSTLGMGEGNVCRFHYQRHPSEWLQITEELRASHVMAVGGAGGITAVSDTDRVAP